MTEAKRTLAYLCPVCKQSVVVERTAFQLAAANSELPCPCGKSSLITELVGERVRLTIPCATCGKDHVVECGQQVFLHEKIMAFSCGASGLDCCYVGEDGPVFAAVQRLEEMMDKLEAKGEEQGAFLDEVMMHETLSEIRDIAQNGGISCTCGSTGWNLQVNFTTVDLVCDSCGGVLRIPAATADDLERLCCKAKLEIQCKEGYGK